MRCRRPRGPPAARRAEGAAAARHVFGARRQCGRRAAQRVRGHHLHAQVVGGRLRSAAAPERAPERVLQHVERAGDRALRPADARSPQVQRERQNRLPESARQVRAPDYRRIGGYGSNSNSRRRRRRRLSAGRNADARRSDHRARPDQQAALRREGLPVLDAQSRHAEDGAHRPRDQRPPGQPGSDPRLQLHATQTGSRRET